MVSIGSTSTSSMQRKKGLGSLGGRTVGFRSHGVGEETPYSASLGRTSTSRTKAAAHILEESNDKRAPSSQESVKVVSYNMLRVSSTSVLIVPPHECAWLTGDFELPEPGRGCVVFECRGKSDATVILKAAPGADRFQNLVERLGVHPVDRDHYMVVLGSHRNTRLNIERNGESVFQARGITISASEWRRFFVDFNNGTITVGCGDPDHGEYHRYVDADPICKPRYVGLSTWDSDVGYRDLRVLPPLDFSEIDDRIRRSNQLSFPSSVSLEWFKENSEFSDLEFVLEDGTRIPAHRFVLEISCPGISKRFPKEEWDLPGTNQHTIDIFLHYVYGSGPQQLSRDEFLDLEKLAKHLHAATLLHSLHSVRKNDVGSDTQHSFVLQSLPPFKERVWMTPSAVYVGGGGDAVLRVDNCQFQIHKLLFSVHSMPIFRMFASGMSESFTCQAVVNETSPLAMDALVTYTYTGHVCSTDIQNLFDILLLAHRLEMGKLSQECLSQVEKLLDIDNVIAVLSMTEYLGDMEAVPSKEDTFCSNAAINSCRNAAVDWMAENICSVLEMQGDSIPDLSIASMKGILLSPKLRGIPESKVLDLVLSWQRISTSTASAESVELIHDLLPLVRFPLMLQDYLLDLQKSRLACKSRMFATLVEEALLSKLDTNDVDQIGRSKQPSLFSVGNGREFQGSGHLAYDPHLLSRFHRRTGHSHELMYMSDGDNNGVFHFLATDGGQHSWINPALTRKVETSSSSPLSKVSDHRWPVSGTYHSSSHYGPSYDSTTGTKRTYWQVHLTNCYTLQCNYYSLRSDGSLNFPRNWIFEGSEDGKSWFVLSRHVDDRSLRKSGQHCSWPIRHPQSTLSCSTFRIVLTGPSSVEFRAEDLCISNVELYGYLNHP